MRETAMGVIVSLLAVINNVAIAEEEWSDAQIKSVLVNSSGYEDDDEIGGRHFRMAQIHCADSNRFARLICEVAQTNNKVLATDMISDLGFYGTRAQLPFLYSVVTNTSYGDEAAMSIIRIEGITSNGVAFVRHYLSPSNNLSSVILGDRWRYEVGSCFLSEIKRIGENCAFRSEALEVVREYMANVNSYHEWMDKAMMKADSSYVQSKRRLSVLRAVMARNTQQYDFAYITNVINALVAYPEANLPE